jgi:putative transcriptional regulator
MSVMDELSGHLLLALPTIGDPRFHRSVIAMCSHDREGALGIDIASPIAGMRVGDVFEQFAIATTRRFDQPVLFGGPVEPQRGFILHSDDWHGPGALKVAGRWSLSASLETLQAIAQGEGPRNWLLALGYAGWGDGQLEGELAANAWHVGDYDEDLFYRASPDEKWTATFAAQGIDADRIALTGGSA